MAPTFDAHHAAPVVENYVPFVDAHRSQAWVQGAPLHLLPNIEDRLPRIVPWLIILVLGLGVFLIRILQRQARRWQPGRQRDEERFLCSPRYARRWEPDAQRVTDLDEVTERILVRHARWDLPVHERRQWEDSVRVGLKPKLKGMLGGRETVCVAEEGRSRSLQSPWTVFLELCCPAFLKCCPLGNLELCAPLRASAPQIEKKKKREKRKKEKERKKREKREKKRERKKKKNDEMAKYARSVRAQCLKGKGLPQRLIKTNFYKRSQCTCSRCPCT